MRAPAFRILLGAAALAMSSVPASARTVVRIGDSAPVYAAPDGALLRSAGGPVLEHGSAWVARRRGGWLGIRTAYRRDGELGWIRETWARPLMTTALLVTVELGAHRVVVTQAGVPLLVAPVAVGARRSPTPVTSTSVAERLVVTPSSGYSRRAYGPVIVALRLWQPAPSPRFPTGGMMAFHGGVTAAPIGFAVSAGCLRMRDRDVERLAELVRAGTPVVIRP